MGSAWASPNPILAIPCGPPRVGLVSTGDEGESVQFGAAFQGFEFFKEDRLVELQLLAYGRI